MKEDENIKTLVPDMKGSRINEVGRKIEETLVNEMNKLLLIARRLGKTSYPDIEISQKQLSKKQSTYDISTVVTYKIKANARHLVLNIAVTEEWPRYWKVDDYEIGVNIKKTSSVQEGFDGEKSRIKRLSALTFVSLFLISNCAFRRR